MILQELVRYYERKDTALAPEGFEQKEIDFVILLDSAGAFLQIEDTRTPDGRKKRARSYLVPKGAKKSVDVAANLLWGNAEYVLGADIRNKPEEAAKRHRSFRKLLTYLPADDIGVRAVRMFLDDIPWKQLKQSQSWEEIQTSKPTLSFQLRTDTELTCQREAVLAALQAGVARPNTKSEACPRGICLVRGEDSEIERLHPAIKGVWGAQASGAIDPAHYDRTQAAYLTSACRK